MSATGSDEAIGLRHGAGGKQMDELILSLTSSFPRGKWSGVFDDSAILDFAGSNLAFTSDSFTVKPLFFPESDIGALSLTGTLNDLYVCGADPLGVSMSLIVEEGFAKDDLLRIMDSAANVAKKEGIAIATGDTKVMGKGDIDGVIIATSAVGTCEKPLCGPVEMGDVILASRNLGDHEACLLALRFGYGTDLKSDCSPLGSIMRKIRERIKIAKDPTRGGLVSSLTTISQTHKVDITFCESDVPVDVRTRAICEMLGIDRYVLASEGALICVCKKEHAEGVLEDLRGFDENANIIGYVDKSSCKPSLYARTPLGALRRVRPHQGTLNPRIC